jgi:hypothetical protein
MAKKTISLKERLGIFGTIKVAQEKIKEVTGVDIPYKTLLYWTNGRIDIESCKRFLALQEFLHLDNNEFIAMLEESHKTQLIKSWKNQKKDS